MLLSSVPYSLHFPTLFSSSSNLCCLHISTVLTSLLSSHLYSLHIPTLFTSTFSSHLFFFTSLLSSTLERRTQTGPVAQTRFPTSTPGATFRDKHRVSCDSYPPSITWTNRWSSHSAAKCKPGSPNTMAQRIFKKHLRAALTVGNTRAVNQRQPHPSHNEVPAWTPGATLCEKTHGFVQFQTSKHHLHAAIPLRSAITGLQTSPEENGKRVSKGAEGKARSGPI